MKRPSPERIKVLRQRIDRVRSILLEHWDPLSVGSNPNLSDEYDIFLGRVLAAVDTGEAATVNLVLAQAEEEMGLGSAEDGEERVVTVRHLLELREA